MLLKRIAWALVAVWFFSLFYSIFQYFYIIQNYSFKTIEATGDMQTYPILLLVALFIWVLSHIFQKGVELEHDKELTI